MEPWFTATLARVEKPSEELRILHWDVPNGANTHFVPGQFVKLEMNDGESFQRSYSIASLSCDADFGDGLELACSSVEGGRATAYFWQAEPGDTLEVYGPYGQLVLPEKPPRCLWLVSTGTGVAPYRAMVPRLESWLCDGAVDVHFLLGARDQNGMLYLDLWRMLAQKYENFHLSLCYSRQLPAAGSGAKSAFDQHAHVQDIISEYA